MIVSVGLALVAFGIWFFGFAVPHCRRTDANAPAAPSASKFA